MKTKEELKSGAGRGLWHFHRAAPRVAAELGACLPSEGKLGEDCARRPLGRLTLHVLSGSLAALCSQCLEKPGMF